MFCSVLQNKFFLTIKEATFYPTKKLYENKFKYISDYKLDCPSLFISSSLHEMSMN